MITRLLAALSSVTIFRFGDHELTPSSLDSLSKYLPLVGLVISIVLETILCACIKTNVPPLVRALIITMAWVVITGGIHLDGLMDTADGLFSHRSRERMLEIMRDSRVGNFGAIAGVFVILTKLMTLASVSVAPTFVLLALIPSCARFAETLTIACFPYAREEGMGKVWHETTKVPGDLFLAAIVPVALTAVVSVYADPAIALITSAATICAGMFAAWRINGTLQGHTGDTYGAVVEIAEVGGLLLATIAFWH